MSNFFRLIFVLAMTIRPAHSSEPIIDVAIFEARALACFNDKEKVEECFRQSIQPHFAPTISESETFASKIKPVFLQMSGSDRVFAIHKARRKVIENLFDERAYVIELTTDGAFLLLEMTFIAIKGKWYIHKFNMSNRDESFQKALDVGW
ncbi:MAG TPA: hypothetical protein VFV64_00775 [Permianibacter sp.]|nr:hypothetical protein [Permianibacter sp.]